MKLSFEAWWPNGADEVPVIVAHAYSMRGGWRGIAELAWEAALAQHDERAFTVGTVRECEAMYLERITSLQAALAQEAQPRCSEEAQRGFCEAHGYGVPGEQAHPEMSKEQIESLQYAEMILGGLGAVKKDDVNATRVVKHHRDVIRTMLGDNALIPFSQ